MIGSLIDFSGQVLFMNNADPPIKIVAIHLESFSQIRFRSGLEMTFSQNNGMYVVLCNHLEVLNYDVHMYSYGASILVGSPTASTTFDQLAFNPQCFAIYEDRLLPPGQWENVRQKNWLTLNLTH